MNSVILLYDETFSIQEPGISIWIIVIIIIIIIIIIILLLLFLLAIITSPYKNIETTH